MSNEKVNVEQFDHWLKDESEVAALVLHQWLKPVEEVGLEGNAKAVIFPPTYAKPEGTAGAEWTGYNIDHFGDNSNVCLIDSVGSQANRMEPTFKHKDCISLVPQVSIKAGKHNIDLLDAGHRAADAIVRFAGNMKNEVNEKEATENSGDAQDAQEDEKSSNGKPLGEQLWDAFKAYQKCGNAEPLAKIAPTSIVFGVWDSRATQVKLPRIVRSVIRAYNVKRHTRSAQFNTPLHYVDEGLIDEKHDKGEGDKNPLSQEGFRHSPATGKHGGIEVMGDIRRDASINLVALRNLSVTPLEEEDIAKTTERMLCLRRYILGLSLVALTRRSAQQFNLREGCLLRISKSSAWKAVPFEGDEKDISIEPADAIAFANEVARIFGVQSFNKPFLFENKKAESWVGRTKEDRDKLRRKDAVIKQKL